ncbi:unnamed protein product [Rotaria magnacalcarata]|uniref:Uncharacterized protein n=2 Tax=Rotaria magnacalcarata TaxID=392030 RepID=A0A816VU75_9BILA|nr:unnamed protein product [Rotaria magnacalcarata]
MSMFQLDVLIDTSVLPSNVMSLRDDKFIDFVQAEAGGGAAALLEIQGINCVKSLLMTSNVYSIMDLKSKSLDGFKNKYGYMQDDGTFVIHPGIKGNIEYLIDLLKKKCIEDAKVAKSSKYNQSSSSTIAKSTSSVPSNSSPKQIPSKSSNLSVGEHKTYIIETLNSWCENNKSKFNLLKLSSIEGQHYFISIFNDPSGALKCDIKCCCKKWSSLTLRRGKFQLSNFYRHLQGSGNVCLELKKMINNSQLPLPSTTNTQQSLTTSDYVPQQVALANFIPIIPSSDIIQSNSTSSTASSISTSTDNNERIIQQSSSLPTRR